MYKNDSRWGYFLQLFKPIIKMMGNLKDGQKFSFIGVILGIPIFLLTLVFITELNEDIKLTDERLIGVSYSKQLKDLLQNVQLHRSYSINSFAGDKDSK